MRKAPKCRHRHFGPYADRPVMPRRAVLSWWGQYSGARRGIAGALGVWSEGVEEGQEAVGRGVSR